ncbi:hypothetical protein ACVWZR_005454 [Bradyrhizobium sp. i1.3.1]
MARSAGTTTSRPAVRSIFRARRSAFTIRASSPARRCSRPIASSSSFHNLWTIEAPEGYSLFFTHPVNRFDLPFITLSGLVDCDRYRDSWIHFPAHWHNTGFRGVLPKGTPIAQCIPVKREDWTRQTSAFTEDEAQKVHALRAALKREPGLYRRKFRA